MHFVGKILVVLVFILSIMFMAFAGVVYNAHVNWRTEALKQKDNVKKALQERDDTLAQLANFKNETDQKLKLAENKAADVEATNRGLVADLKNLQDKNNLLNVAGKTASEQAQIAEEEALARREEAQNLRQHDHEKALKLDANFAEKTKLEDLAH